jgi:hypothetical protein
LNRGAFIISGERTMKNKIMIIITWVGLAAVGALAGNLMVIVSINSIFKKIRFS